VAATRDPIFTTVYQVTERRPCALLLMWDWYAMQFRCSTLHSRGFISCKRLALLLPASELLGNCRPRVPKRTCGS